MQSRVMNKPYDVFGTWYNDCYLLSGNLHWAGHLNSCSVLSINKVGENVEISCTCIFSLVTPLIFCKYTELLRYFLVLKMHIAKYFHIIRSILVKFTFKVLRKH